MKIASLLEHHGIVTNPFADEDAQTDQVFKAACIRDTFHPAWDKIYGDPGDPSTSVVFGEKGSGKTALRLQMTRHMLDYNANHPDRQVFVIGYDDFNPPLDRFRERYSGRRRKPEKFLGKLRLWDHMDAILALGVTQLVDRVLGADSITHPAARKEQLKTDSLEPSQRRDVLLLAACYDQSTGEGVESRWHRLRKKLHFSVLKSHWPFALGVAVTFVVLVALLSLGWGWSLLKIWPYLFIAAGWAPFLWRQATSWLLARRIKRQTRTLNQETGRLRRLLMRLAGQPLSGQPLPRYPRSDDRYELLAKFQGVLRALKFEGIVILIDRVDEPYLINGTPELMKSLIWPMLENKFLKHPGLGVKLLLPSELEPMLDRESREFHQRSRLDKQNLIRSLAWTGQSLYDLAGARITACSDGGGRPVVDTLFAPAVSRERLVDAFTKLRVPRHLFKFMYRLMTTHCNAHSDDAPVWQISSEMFESQLALFLRDQETLDRGLGPG